MEDGDSVVVLRVGDGWKEADETKKLDKVR